MSAIHSACTTCRNRLSHLEIPFIEGREEIMNNDKYKTKKEKEQAIRALVEKLTNNDCCVIKLIAASELVK